MAELKGANRYDYEVVKLLRLMDAEDMMLQTMNVMLQQFAEDPDFPKIIEKIQQKVDIDSVLYQMVPIYNRYYTREEIARLIAFYETPLGRKGIREFPQILQETIAANQTWIEAIAKNIDAIANDVDSLFLKVELKKYENEIEINKLFDIIGLNFNTIASEMLEACIKDTLEQNQNMNVSASDIALFRDMFYKNMNIEILRNHYLAIYNHHYSQEEIAGLIAFHESPLGRKFAQVEPKIIQEFQAASQAYFESLGKEIAEELIAEDS